MSDQPGSPNRRPPGPPSGRRPPGPAWMQYPQAGDDVIYEGKVAKVTELKDTEKFIVDLIVFADDGNHKVEDVPLSMNDGWHPCGKDMRDPRLRRSIPRDFMRDLMNIGEWG